MALQLTRVQVDAMIQHAREDYPNECCGILAGFGDQVHRVYRMRNADKSPYTFNFDENEHLRVHKDIDARGLELVGFYHSHTWSQPNPSATDNEKAFRRNSETGEAQAHYPNAGYVIVSLRDRASPEVRAFRIGDSFITEEELVVV